MRTKTVRLLQEHDKLPDIDVQTDKLEHLSLISWEKPKESSSWGYYASFQIGAEWVDDNEAIVVTTKRKMENIDFLKMFMTCFSSNLATDAFSSIYSINIDKPAIEAPSLRSVISPLIVFHFLGIVSRIKTLKKGYVHYSENIKKIKGHISILKNERKNIAMKRYDRIYCNYDEYSENISENRLLKKALLFSQRMISTMTENNDSYHDVKLMLIKSLSLFENVSDNVDIKDIKQIKGHKLFKEYAEAIRLAKLVLCHFDYSINKVSETNNMIPPFVLNMSLLYEHYVYGLLYKAYKDKIVYQFKGVTGIPDFLYCSTSFKAILDTKYIPKYDEQLLDNNVIWQLSGYSRDIHILRRLGYDVDEDFSVVPPCVIIYPEEKNNYTNPFTNKHLDEICTIQEPKLLYFYKIAVPIPVIK